MSVFFKLRWFFAIVSVVAGVAAYKFGPTVWHEVQDRMDGHKKPMAKAGAKANSLTNIVADPMAGPKANANVVLDGDSLTNDFAVKLSDCDLGAVSLTNHYETSVSLGKGRSCILTPNMIDSRNVQLTLTVESKDRGGHVHDLSITQVIVRPGKPLNAAVGGYSFSLTPNMVSE